MDFDHLILQLAHVPEAFQNVSKEKTTTVNGQTIESWQKSKRVTPLPAYFRRTAPADALVFAYVLARFSNGNALYG